MADAKISALPAATTPLAGTEVVPLVQSGTTKKVAVSAINTPLASTFASLPAASGVSGQIYRVTDVGVNGSLWFSDGTKWCLLNGSANLFEVGIYFGVPSSGTITAVTGALALTTAMPLLFRNCYLYFPAGAWTGSAAGWYYVEMSSASAGLVYSNQWTGGVPTIPTSKTLVTTGAGAYTQTTGSALVTPTVHALPGNVLGTQGRLKFVGNTINNNSGTSKYPAISYGSANMALGANSTGVFAQGNATISCLGNTQYEVTYTSYNSTFNAPGYVAVDSTASQNISFNVTIYANTDFCVFNLANAVLEV